MKKIACAFFCFFILINHAEAFQVIDLLEEMNRTAQTAVASLFRIHLPFSKEKQAHENFPSRQFNRESSSKKALIQERAEVVFHEGDETTVLFKDIVGIDCVLAEVAEVADYLKSPEDFSRLGARMPRGILLEGPPGCGKTMIARAIANEARCNFEHISGSEFINKFVGVGASNVRELFKKAREKSPTILFIDEFDAIAGVDRSTLSGDGGSMEYKQTINQLLTELDGFKSGDSIIVIAATNDADSLDAAVKRSGRFDRLIHVPLPNEDARRKLLNNYLGKLPSLGSDVTDDLQVSIAQKTDGLCAADFKNMVNEMAIFAVREKSDAVYARHVRAGSEKVINQRLKSMTLKDFRTLYKSKD